MTLVFIDYLFVRSVLISVVASEIRIINVILINFSLIVWIDPLVLIIFVKVSVILIFITRIITFLLIPSYLSFLMSVIIIPLLLTPHTSIVIHLIGIFTTPRICVILCSQWLSGLNFSSAISAIIFSFIFVVIVIYRSFI